MSGTVRLSRDLRLPAAELATKIVAALGMRGSGKSNVMSSIAEQLLEAKIPVIVLDDVGIWYSLRLKEDGRTPSGLDIPVLGGRHGDIALLPTAGELVARTLAETGSSAVLDISGFRKGERARFAAAFAEAFFHAKKENAGPVFLILEESQRWVPQVIRFKGEGEERMLGAFMEIAEVGRNFGIGMGLLSQRPQKVHKEVLNLTELLLAFQTNGVLERKAIAEWVQEVGADGREQINNVLPGLHVGEALVWSPSWLRIFERTKLQKKWTYDAGATPLTARAQVQTRPIELGALSAAMAVITDEIKASDPKELRAEVVRLRAELKKKQPERVEIRPMIPAWFPPILAKLRGQAADLLATLQDTRIIDNLREHSVPAIRAQRRDQHQSTNGKSEMAALSRSVDAAVEAGNGAMTRALDAQLERQRRRAREPAPATPSGADGAAPGRMLRALAMRHPDKLSKRQLATLSGVVMRLSTFRSAFARLKNAGHIHLVDDMVGLTEDGLVAAGGPRPAMSGKELLAMWMAEVRGKAKDMLEFFATEARPITKSELAAHVAVDQKLSTFRSAMAQLTTRDLVRKTGKGHIINPELAQ